MISSYNFFDKVSVEKFVFDNLFLFVVVKPNKNKNVLVDFKDGVLFIELNAKPVDGEANKVLLSFLKKEFKSLNKNFVFNLKSGFSSKKKKIVFERKK